MAHYLHHPLVLAYMFILHMGHDSYCLEYCISNYQPLGKIFVLATEMIFIIGSIITQDEMMRG